MDGSRLLIDRLVCRSPQSLRSETSYSLSCWDSKVGYEIFIRIHSYYQNLTVSDGRRLRHVCSQGTAYVVTNFEPLDVEPAGTNLISLNLVMELIHTNMHIYIFASRLSLFHIISPGYISPISFTASKKKMNKLISVLFFWDNRLFVHWLQIFSNFILL